MDYKRIYDEFINDRRLKETSLTGYAEWHHITPRAMGGGDNPENLIHLTAEDHLFAHVLLARAYGGSLWYALTLMLRPARRLGVDRGKRAIRIAAAAKREQSRRQLGIKRPDVSLALKGRVKSEEHRNSLSKARKGWRDSAETRAKKSAALKLRVHTPERNAKLSASLRGRQFSPEHRAKISASAKVRYVGAGNPRYDKSIREFTHIDGRVEQATKYDLAQKYGLNRTCLNYVIKGERPQTGGWRFTGNI